MAPGLLVNGTSSFDALDLLLALVLLKNTGQNRTHVDADVNVGRKARGLVKLAREKIAVADAHLHRGGVARNTETQKSAEGCGLVQLMIGCLAIL